MKRLSIIFGLLMLGNWIFAQSKPLQVVNLPAGSHLHEGGAAMEEDMSKHAHQEMIQAMDSLTMSDYTLGIERVNDNLIAIGDSAKLGFEVVRMDRRIGVMTNDIQLIRQNLRGRNAVFNIKNQFLYQRFTDKLETETDLIQAKLDIMYRRVAHAKTHLNVALADSVFQKMYANKVLRASFNDKLIRLDRKWHRTDSLTRANLDTLNAIKVRLSDNSYNLSNMLSILERKMDRAVPQLFGPEVNNLWGKELAEPTVKSSSGKASGILESEQKAIAYYINQTSGERKLVLILGILLFTWIYFKRKLLKKLCEQHDVYSYLDLRYLHNHPVLSLLVLLLCLMPFFDAYAPTSYIAIEYLLLLITSSVILLKKGERTFLFNWFVLIALYFADVFAYLVMEPNFVERIMLLAIHSGIIMFSYRLYKTLSKRMPYYRMIYWSTVCSMVLAGFGILLNLFGRFSLAGMVGVAAIFAVTQAIVLTIFVEIIVEVVLLQLQSSRMKNGLDKPFDTSIVIGKIKAPLILIAVYIWIIMLASNLNLYHSISKSVVESLTTIRTIGSISFQMLSVILFFVIIWIAHILQRLLSFFFGETGIDSEDVTTVTKGQHSRLLVTRLLVLIGGYLLAIAASGLPIDKLTFLLGALGVGIGMGLQGIVNNFVSGIILIFDGSLQIGDEIEVSGQSGKVKEIGLRASTLSTSDGADVIIPNGSILSQNIVNWTFSNNEKRVMISFALLGNELDANLINEVINETIKKIPNVISKRNPVILFTKVKAGSCRITVRFWSTISNVDLVKSEAMLQLSSAFTDKKIGFK